ncbi:RHS repeat-associated core domain-containing protein, partial [Xenorhabdus bovienii]|uniref:RHS repeat-associated core domain-containing protein n=1 Tax=Xenorhabdus bovienii TaxID=40576 RepID=UPI002804541B
LVFDGWQLLAQQVQFFTPNPENRSEVLAGKIQTQYAVCAPTGEPLALFDAAGHRVWRQPPQSLYGLRLGVLGENAELNPGLKFAGQFLDEESGLVYNRHRYYSPVASMYLTPDPIGLLGGENLYSYVGNPTGFIDPLGLSGLGIVGSMVRKVKGRLPINSKHAGKIYPASELPVEIRNKYPHGVPFTHSGFPDFSRYSIKNVRIELGKTRTVDFARADAAAGYSRSNPRPTGYTWHHHHDSGYMQLIPTDIHSKVKHTGGVATRKCPKGK